MPFDEEDLDPHGECAAEIKRLRDALTFIAGMKDMTLIAPSLGSDGDKAHQLGAVKAFNQCAQAAADAING